MCLNGEGPAVREFQKPIGRAWRRMRFQRFLTALVWTWGVALAGVALALTADRLLAWSLPGPAWLPFAAAEGIGLVVALGIALLTGPSRVDAAVAIDHAFHLNERLSTALTLPDDLRETPAGRALVADALRHAGDLDIASQFRLRLPRRAWVPLIPAALAVALLFVPDLARTTRADQVTRQVDQKRVAAVTRALGRKIGERRKEVDKTDASQTEKILAQIE